MVLSPEPRRRRRRGEFFARETTPFGVVGGEVLWSSSGITLMAGEFFRFHLAAYVFLRGVCGSLWNSDI